METAVVFIQPHERSEAIDAYKDKLTPQQIEEIQGAPDTAIIQLSFASCARETRMVVIEEG